MHKTLFIYNAFLRKNSPGGQIIRPFISELSKLGLESKIVCDTATVESWNNPFCDVFCVPESRPIHNIMAIIRRLFPDLSFLPDTEYYSWAPSATGKAIELIRKNKPDYIHSVSLANANHLVALKLKEMFGIPWIAQFYDPWVNNYFRPYYTQFFKEKDSDLEKKVALNADIILHTNVAMCKDWMNRYGDTVKNKMFVLPLSMPQQPDYIPHKRKDGDILTISHIGNFYKGRTSSEFIRAVADFLNKYPAYRKSIVINYVGNVENKDRELILDLNLSDVFNLMGRISQNECVDYYINSDIFLAIDGVGKDNLFFPSKILKYFYYQKPILGITPKGSVLDEELMQYGCKSISNFDKEGLVNYLKNAIEDYNSLFNKIDMRYWENFSVDSVAKKYMDIIKTI